MRKICIVNQKGGVGKTTTAINLGYCLARNGKRVLIVDLDPQGHATIGLGIERNSFQKSMKDALLNGTSLDDIIQPTGCGLSVAPATIHLDRAEQQLISEMYRERRVDEKLASLEKYEFDYVLMDCRPTLGVLTVNAIYTAEMVLIPCQFSSYALDGMADLLGMMETIKKGLGQGWFFRVLMTMYDARKTVMNQWVEKELAYFFEKGLMLDTYIRVSEPLNQAAGIGKPVGIVAPRSHGAEDYQTLAGEVVCL